MVKYKNREIHWMQGGVRGINVLGVQNRYTNFFVLGMVLIHPKMYSLKEKLIMLFGLMVLP
jgi:hypothetical protein